MHMCRFCKNLKSHHRMVKYAARHWAHFDCWLDAKGKELGPKPTFSGMLEMLKGLHGWQLAQFPVFALADWLKAHKAWLPMRGTWVDQAMWLIKEAGGAEVMA